MEIKNSQEVRIAARLFIFMAVVAILIAGRQLIIPFTIAVFFTFLLHPVSRKLIELKFPKFLAIILSLLLAVIFFGGLVYFFVDQLNNFKNDLPLLNQQLTEKASNFLIWVEAKTDIPQEKQIIWIKDKLGATADEGPKILMNIFSTTGTFIAMFALIPIYVFFLTYFKDKYKKFIVLVDKKNHENTLVIVKKISDVSRKYLKGVFLDVMILSVLGSVGYLLLGIEHAILFGVLAAMLNIIPYVGVMIGSLLPVMMAIITKDDIGYAFGAMGVAAVVQFIDNNFIAPYVIGSSVSINPLTAIIVLITGALLWGIAGMILSIPIAGMLKVAFDNIESLKPYGYLIGEEVNYSEKMKFTLGKKK